jgi:hypothetical protein
MTALLSHTPRNGHRTVPDPGQRPLLEQELRRHEVAASKAAERGDMQTSARSILALLDCERRLGAQGPQVLQVIKPRAATAGRVLS